MRIVVARPPAVEDDVPADLLELDARMRGECARVITAPVYHPPLVEQLLG